MKDKQDKIMNLWRYYRKCLSPQSREILMSVKRERNTISDKSLLIELKRLRYTNTYLARDYVHSLVKELEIGVR